MTDQIVITDGGIPMLLEWMLQLPIVGLSDMELVLFQDELDPDCTVAWDDLTECDFTGYARVTLNRASWQAPTVVGCCGIMLYGEEPISWTNTGSAQNVGGYGFIFPTGPVLVCIQALSDIIELPPFGTLSIRPQFTLTSGVCPSA